MNPMAMLKVVAALTPLMGNQDLADAMATEIKAIFQGMTQSAQALENIDGTMALIADALRSINARLGSIEEKLQGLKLPLSNGEIHQLLEHNNSVDQPL